MYFAHKDTVFVAEEKKTSKFLPLKIYCTDLFLFIQFPVIQVPLSIPFRFFLYFFIKSFL